MNKRYFLPTFIALCHIPIFLLRFPEKKPVQKVQKKIAINTIHLLHEVPAKTMDTAISYAKPKMKKSAPPSKKKRVQKKAKPKKLARKKNTKKKIQKALKKSLAQKKPHSKSKQNTKTFKAGKKKSLVGKKKNTKKDAGKGQREYNQYLQTVVQTLKDSLTLPEAGKVKLAITVSETGKIIKIVSLFSESASNLTYLKEYLPALSLPKYAKKENRTFTIVFCDEK